MRVLKARSKNAKVHGNGGEGAVAGAVWTVEAEFQGRTVRVAVAGETPRYTAEVGVPPLGGAPEPPKGGTPNKLRHYRDGI